MMFANLRHRIAFNAGTVLLHRGRWRLAALLLRHATKVSSDHWEAHNSLAVALLKLKRWKDAAIAAERAVQLDPGAADSHDLLGIALLQLQRSEEAATVYRQALAVRPGRYEFHDRLGMALWQLERWEELVEACEAALRLEAGHYATHHRLGMALLRLERWEAAAAALRRAIALAAEDATGAGEVAGMRMNLATAVVRAEDARRQVPPSAPAPVDPEFLQRQARFWTADNLGAEVFAVERWLERLTAVPEPAPAGPRLLFVLDNDFGELTTVKYFLLGQELAGRATLLLPQRLYDHNQDAIPGRTHRYESIAGILDVVDRERPAVVFLCSGYLLCEHLSIPPEQLVQLLDRLRERGCQVVTADPYLGMLSQQEPRELISFQLPREQALRFVAEKYGADLARAPEILDLMTQSRQAAEEQVWAYLAHSERALRDTYHLYPACCDLSGTGETETDARNISFFNDRLLRAPVLPRGESGRPHWLFVLANTDYDLQRVFEGVAGFVDIVAGKLTETVAAGRHPILIAPAPFIEQVLARLPSTEGMDLLSHCPFNRFMSLLMSAEQVFYWNAVSHSLLIRLHNGLPIVLFDRGHLLRIAPAVQSRIVAWYYQGWEPPIRDHHRPLTLATVEEWATEFRRQAGHLPERYRRAPSPGQMIDELMSRAAESLTSAANLHAERIIPS